MKDINYDDVYNIILNNKSTAIEYIISMVVQLFLFIVSIIFIVYAIKGNGCKDNKYYKKIVAKLENKVIKKNKDGHYDIIATIKYKDKENKEYVYNNVTIKTKNCDIKAQKFFDKNNEVDIYYLKTSPSIYILDKPSKNYLYEYTIGAILCFFIVLCIHYKNFDFLQTRLFKDLYKNSVQNGYI